MKLVEYSITEKDLNSYKSISIACFWFQATPEFQNLYLTFCNQFQHGSRKILFSMYLVAINPYRSPPLQYNKHSKSRIHEIFRKSIFHT